MLEVAVIGIPDDYWGEVPKAFVTLKPGADVDARTSCARSVVRSSPGSKSRKRSSSANCPKTSTGKIQKFVLREREWAGQEKRIN